MDDANDVCGPYRYDIMAADLPRASSRFRLLLERLTPALF
jgi:hypothetical protein